MPWAYCPEIRMVFIEFIVVSAKSMIGKRKPTVTMERNKKTFRAHDLVHGPIMNKIFAFDGKTVWTEHVQMRKHDDSKPIYEAIGLTLQNAAAKSYEEFVSVLIHSEQDSTITRCFDFVQSGISVEWSKMRRNW